MNCCCWWNSFCVGAKK
uniref:Uncharacterized protein n=1 Tax=Anguilla anguilla TaxID=7936 RepID=A0A0E9VND5_ANGAN